jgi:hypothetical protein
MSSEELEIPEFLKRPVTHMGDDGRLWSEELFSANETFGGFTREALILKVAKRLAVKMEKAGAIAPYEFSCAPAVGGFAMKAVEV